MLLAQERRIRAEGSSNAPVGAKAGGEAKKPPSSASPVPSPWRSECAQGGGLRNVALPEICYSSGDSTAWRKVVAVVVVADRKEHKGTNRSGDDNRGVIGSDTGAEVEAEV